VQSRDWKAASETHVCLLICIDINIYIRAHRIKYEEKLGTRVCLMLITSTVHALYYMLLNKRFDIGTVICPRVVVMARGRRTRANTTARGQITVLILKLLFNDNFIT